MDDWVDWGRPAMTFRDFTIIAWANFSSLPSTMHQKILGIPIYTTAAQYIALIYKPTIQKMQIAYRDDGGKERAANTTFTPQINRWYFWVGMKDGSSIKIYSDGSLNSSSAVTTNTITTNGTSYKFSIGGNPFWGSIYYVSGLIDELRIYNRALSDTEIKAIYDATK